MNISGSAVVTSESEILNVFDSINSMGGTIINSDDSQDMFENNLNDNYSSETHDHLEEDGSDYKIPDNMSDEVLHSTPNQGNDNYEDEDEIGEVQIMETASESDNDNQTSSNGDDGIDNRDYIRRRKRKKRNVHGGRPKSSGRKKDTIWSAFKQNEGGNNQWSCNLCCKPMTGNATRMRKHKSICDIKNKWKLKRNMSQNGTIIQPACSLADRPTTSFSFNGLNDNIPKTIQPTMSRFLDKITEKEKNKIDEALARFVCRASLPFNVVEYSEFTEFCNLLRPAYNPPSRKVIGGRLMDELNAKAELEMKKTLNNKKVTVLQDGWSKSLSEPIIAHSVAFGSKSYILNAKETQEEVKSAEYCVKLFEEAIIQVEEEYGAQVIGSVTDNCNTMKSLRKKLCEELPHLYVYGCNSHLLNLVGKRLTPSALLDKIVKLQKYFKNHQFAGAKLKQLKGLRPVLPADTRWNSQIACMENYLQNQSKYIEVSRMSGAKFPSEISEILIDNELYGEIKKSVNKLFPIAVSLDQLQGDSSTIADAVNCWIKLSQELEFENEDDKRYFKKQKAIGLTDFSIAAYMLHPKYRGKNLKSKLIEKGRKWLSEKNPYYLILAGSLQRDDTTIFPRSLLDHSVADIMLPCNWWQDVASQNTAIPSDFVDLVDSLMRLPCSTGNIERCFSNLGRIFTTKRGNLEIKKGVKMCKINYALMKK